MKLRLFSKLMLLVMLPVFGILIALSGFTYLTAERIMRKQIYDNMFTVLGQQTQEYQRYFKNMSEVVNALSGRGFAAPCLFCAQHAVNTDLNML